MKVCINVHDISVYGGIEKQMLGLAHWLTLRGHEVFLLSATKPGVNPGFPVDNGPCIIHHDYTGDAKQLTQLRGKVAEVAPDICISPATDRRHLVMAAALWKTPVPWILAIRTTPRLSHLYWPDEHQAALLSGADAVAIQFAEYRKYLPSFVQCRTHVVPNIVPAPRCSWPTKTTKTNKILLSLSRLAPEKQIHLLIQAFQKLSSHFPQWELHIWGDGEEETNLKKIALQNNCGKIFFKGKASDVFQQCFSRADAFCIPSHYEGFPGSLAEAMSYGIPAVGFSQCDGVNGLISHGQTGLLAEEMTADSLASALHRLLGCARTREALAAEAQKAMLSYAADHVNAQWEALLQSTAACARQNRLFQRPAFADKTEQEAYTLLEQLVQRKHIFFADSQIVHRFLWKHPHLLRMARKAKKLFTHQPR